MSKQTKDSSKFQWEYHKDTIVDLFLRQDMTILQVKEEMEKCGFIASERMYQCRFKQWGVAKYDSVAKKDEMCNKLLNDHQNGRSTSYLSPNQLKKLQRHYSENWNTRSLDPAIGDLLRSMHGPSSLPLEPPRNSSNRGGGDDSTDEGNESNVSNVHTPPSSSTARSANDLNKNDLRYTSSSSESISDEIYGASLTSSVARLRLVSPGKSNDLAEVLSLTRDYYQASCEQHVKSTANTEVVPVSTPSGLQDDVNSPLATNKAFWTKVKSGIYFLKMKNEESDRLAWPLLHEAGQMVPQLCAGQPFTFLKDLFATLSPINTRIYPAYRNVLLELFIKKATEEMGETHPFPLLCHRLNNDGGAQEISTTSLKLLLELSEDILPEDHSELFDLKRTLIRLLRRQGDFSDAQASSISLIESTEREKGKRHVQTRLAMTELVYVLNDQNQYEKSFGVAQRIIMRAQQDLGPAFPDDRSVYAMEDMAEICDRLGKMEDSITWLRKAMRGALHLWGNKAGTIHIFDKLESMNSRLGR